MAAVVDCDFISAILSATLNFFGASSLDAVVVPDDDDVVFAGGVDVE